MKGSRNFAAGFSALLLLIVILGTAQAAPPDVSSVTTSGGTGIVTLTATAADSDGYITKVGFFWNNGSGSGWVSIGSNTSKSGDNYSRQWDTRTVPNGDYSIQAEATDNNSDKGNGTSSTFAITNNQNPSVLLNSPPSDGDTLMGIVTLSATATDPDGSISKVIFEIDNGTGWKTMGTGTGSGNIYTYSWNTDLYLNDSYRIRAKATDDDSAENTSLPITVFIANPPNRSPVVTINVPVGGQTYNGIVTLSATATDPDGNITSVTFSYNNGSGWQNIGSGSKSADVYTLNWNTAPLANGANYRIRATATDNRGGTTDNTSASFSIYNNHKPVLSNDGATPTSGITPVDFKFTVTYTDNDNDSANFVQLVIDGVGTFNMNRTDSNNPRDGIVYNYTKQLTEPKEYTYQFKAQDINGSDADDTAKKTITVNTKTYESGNRIWAKDAGLSDTYTWTPQTFSGFYYNLDDDIGGETLTISDIDWSLDDGDVVYSTQPISVKFEQTEFGEYYIIGFMAQKYFAGYKDGSSIGDSNDNLLDDEKLSKVLIDSDERRSLKSGNAITLEEGYEFRIVELDITGKQALVGLFKDGWKQKEDVVTQDGTFVYKVDGIPIIGLQIDTVFAGIETSSIIINGIFQISDEFTDVDTGDTFGLMRVSGIRSDKITMENRNSISLSSQRGKTFNLMGKINIEVGDDPDTLRFAPVVDTTEPGTYELRGTVTEEAEFTWTPLNFVGLLYDLDTGEHSETLKLTRSGRSVDDNNLVYTTKPISAHPEYSGWGSYQSIGFMGEKYFAGYEARFIPEISSARSLIAEERLSKILIDDDKRRTMRAGNSIALEEGYNLGIQELSRNGDLFILSLFKDGNEIDSDILGEGDNYYYLKKVDGTNIPIIVAHVDSIFLGFETSSVIMEGVFQISEDFITVESGDSYGKMEVSTVNDDVITLKNDNDFSLSKGETINIMGDVKIRVADDEDVRFYPFLEVIVEEPVFLELDVPESVFQNEEMTMRVTSEGDEIEDAVITFGDIEIGSTDSNGELTYTPADTGTFTVTVSKSGYTSDSAEIDVLFQPKVLEISAPLVVDKGEEIIITVTSENENVDGASVKFGSQDLGTTPSSGNITYTPQEAGTFTILVSKSGYQDASQNIDITDPAAKFVFTNLTIEPRTVEPGQIVNITAEAANFGTIRDSDTAILKINGKTEDTRELLLNPGESIKLSYTANKTTPGTYRVELNDRTGSFRVAGKGVLSTSVIAIIIIAVLVATAIIYSMYHGTLTTDVIAARVQEIKKQLKQLFEK